MTQVRAATLRAFCATRRTRWVCRHVRSQAVIVGREPVLTPLPDIADHIEEPEVVWLERVNRTGARVTVGSCVLLREVSLKNITAVFAVLRE